VAAPRTAIARKRKRKKLLDAYIRIIIEQQSMSTRWLNLFWVEVTFCRVCIYIIFFKKNSYILICYCIFIFFSSYILSLF
jgi:hypothetical protein